MKVNTTISGSHCVVELSPGVNGTYIDARRGKEGLTNIEVVHAGFVRAYETVLNEIAPEKIVELMRRFA